MSKTAVNPSVIFFEPGTHVGRAGSVRYDQKRAMIVATKTKLLFCTDKTSVLEIGQIFSSISYLDPPNKSLYYNYRIVACNTLYLNIVKLEDSSFQLYGKTLKNLIVK